MGEITSPNWTGYVWKNGRGTTTYPDTCCISGVSADGSVFICNSSNFEPGIWTSTGGVEVFKDANNQKFSGDTWGISSDGKVAVGRMIVMGGSYGFRWTRETGLVKIDGTWGASQDTGAFKISADGSTIVGGSFYETPNYAFQWSQSAGYASLGNLTGADKRSAAYGVSGDGSVIVGDVVLPDGKSTAFIWTQQIGMISLKDYLTQYCGLDMTGWSLTYASDISDDGRTIVGAGYNPQGLNQMFMVKLSPVPEPSSLLALIGGVSCLGLLARRRI